MSISIRYNCLRIEKKRKNKNKIKRQWNLPRGRSAING